MTMQIVNNTGAVIQGTDVTIFWNYATGANGSKALPLTGASLASTAWSGSAQGPNVTLLGFNPYIPTGSSLLTFTFNSIYANIDNTEKISVSLSPTNGCQNYSLITK
jgi:hypothetical protein